MTTETFQPQNFSFEGIYLFYRRANGERLFIARRKYSTMPIKLRDYKTALKGRSVQQYADALESGIGPVEAAGLTAKAEAVMAARRAR